MRRLVCGTVMALSAGLAQAHPPGEHRKPIDHVPPMVLAPPSAAMVSAPPSAPPAPATRQFNTPGAHYFHSATPSPLAGAGSRPAHHANRVFLDDAHTHVTVDAARRRVLIRNTRPYAEETIVADLLLMGHGRLASGRQVPAAVHLKIVKAGNIGEAKVHAHVTSRDPVVASVIDPFVVAFDDGAQTRVVLTPAQSRDAVQDPGSGDAIARALLKFKDHLDDTPGDPTRPGPNQPGYKLADISLGIGRGLLNKYVMRAELVSLDASNAPLIAQKDLPRMLREGAWQLKLTSLSSLLPEDAFKRDLMLLGIADLPLLAAAKRRGLKKGESLIFTLRAGTGSVSFGGKTAPLPGAVDVARAWLEFNFLGLILTDQARRRVGR